MKKLIFLIIFSFISLLNVSAYEVPIDITVNGSYIKTSEKPYIKESLTFVPIRFVSQALGCDVSWENGIATISGENEITLFPGEAKAEINGEPVIIKGGTELKNDRTFVPLRFVAESLNADVDWNEKYYTVEITKDDIKVEKEHIYYPEYDHDHIFWLARIIESESGGESLEGKIAVGNVVLNRVESDEFPDTIYGVIFDDEYGIQFQPVMNGTIYNNPSLDSFIAAKLAISGKNIAGNSLYFLNPDKSTNFWIVDNREYLLSIGEHDFYL